MRIDKSLHAFEDTDNLYANHQSSFLTGTINLRETPIYILKVDIHVNNTHGMHAPALTKV